ncbi:hypothetical protein CTI14_41090, partial [Methylobacterium radiotolerans]
EDELLPMAARLIPDDALAAIGQAMKRAARRRGRLKRRVARAGASVYPCRTGGNADVREQDRMVLGGMNVARRLFGSWVEDVNRVTLRADLAAGLLGALLVLPQGVARTSCCRWRRG